MATLTPTLTLSSTDLTTDTLSVSLTDSLSVLGEVHMLRKKLDSSSTNLTADQLILDASEHNKCYVLLHNTSTTAAEIITIGGPATTGTLDASHIALGAGEFSLFPWDSSVDWIADAASGTPILEVMIFEATA